MLAFSVEFKSGIPIYEQVVYAVKKAIVQGLLKPGDRFPSVREMSRELRINPNTAQKIVSQLVTDRMLVIQPGKGSMVAQLPQATDAQLKEVLEPQIEQLVIDAQRLSIAKATLDELIKHYWLSAKGEN